MSALFDDPWVRIALVGILLGLLLLVLPLLGERGREIASGGWWAPTNFVLNFVVIPLFVLAAIFLRG